MQSSGRERTGASPRQKAAKQRRAANVACGASLTLTIRPRLQSCGAATAGNPNLRQRPIFLRSLLRSLGVWARIGSCGLRRTLHSLCVVAPRLLRAFAEGLPNETDNTHQRTPTAFHNKAQCREAHAGLAMPTHTHTPTGFHKIVIAALCIFALPGCTMITGRLDSEFLNGTEPLGGTITDLILYCPECEKANQAWLRSHEDE